MGDRRARLLFQSALAGTRPFRRCLGFCLGLPFAVIALRALLRRLFGFSGAGRSKWNTGPAGLAQPYCDRLLGRACSVLPSRTCSISSWTNSPAAVEGDFPSCRSSSARSTTSFSGIIHSLPSFLIGMLDRDQAARSGSQAGRDDNVAPVFDI
jgi:hypothetical protein